MVGSIVFSAIVLRQATDPSLDFRNVPATTAIRTLFRANKFVCAWISPRVKGSITFDARGKKFELALGTLLTQIGATYRYAAGECFIFVPGDDDSPNVAPYRPEKTSSVDFDGVDLREGLSHFFQSVGLSFRIEPDVRGKVQFQLKDAPISKILSYMMAGNGARTTNQNGTYVVSSVVSLLDEKVAGIDLCNLDIRDAVRNLLTPYGGRVRYESNIAGVVSFHSGACRVELALQNILSQCNYSYRLDHETFVVIDRGDPDLTRISVGGDDVTSNEAMDFDFDDTDLRQALKVIFKANNASYSISPDIDGKVSLHLKQASLEEALRNILGPFNLTYNYSGGVFLITRSKAVDLKTAPLLKRLPPYQFSDVDLRQALKTIFEQAGVSYWISPDIQGKVHFATGSAQLGDVLSRLLKKTDATYWYENGAFFIGAKPRSSQEILDHIVPLVEFNQVDVKEALREFFGRNNVDYTLSDKVEGSVNLYVRQVTFKQALDYLLKQLDATYRIEGGVFKIVRNSLDNLLILR